MRSIGRPARTIFLALMTSASTFVFGAEVPCAAQPAPATDSAPDVNPSDPPAAGSDEATLITMSPIYSPGDPQPGKPDHILDAPVRGPAGPKALSIVDHALFTHAFDAADRHDWRTARVFAAQGTDPVAKKLIAWRALQDERSGAGFADIDAFLSQSPNWPRQDALIQRAEQIMPAGLDPYQVIAWYGTRAPTTGAGAMRLGEALIAVGRRDAGNATIREGWVHYAFTAAEETQILHQHADALSEADQSARLTIFLDHNDVAGAKRQMSRVDSQTQRLADARLKLKADPALAIRLTGGLDPSLRSDPGLILDSARALRKTGKDEAAWAAMLAAPLDKDTFPAPDQWWSERHIMARDALKAGKPDLAYQLVSTYGMDAGNGLADAEFLSGWIALRYLNKPDVALNHFLDLAKGATLPTSRARAYYWIGRAQEALNRPNDAVASYGKAAKDSSTYYGQLALTRIQVAPILHLPTALPDVKLAAIPFENDERVRAMEVLGDLGERYFLGVFALYLAHVYDSPAQFTLLAQLVAKVEDTSVTLRIAKLASYKDAFLFPYLDPVIDLPAPPKGVDVEPAVVLGLTRQESEFDPAAVSGVGARGLMQVMPASAKEAAKTHGITYRPAELNDPGYNMQLGMAHLSDSLKQWDGSYILSLASYNAGAGTVRNWIAAYGDPREPGVDPIDWIELIPYGETRNYVQRVLENIEVYRNRLAGSDQKLMILNDLYRPNAPSAAIVLKVAATPTAVPVPQRAPERTD